MQARQISKHYQPVVFKDNKLARFAARPEIVRQSDTEPVTS